MGIESRIARLERQIMDANHVSEKEAETMLLDALRQAGQHIAAGTEPDYAARPDLGERLRGTKAGGFLEALREFGAVPMEASR